MKRIGILRRKIVWTLWVIPLFSYSQDISVSSSQDSLKKVDLHAVEIRAYENKRVHQSPVPVQILNEKTLENLNSLSVADAIRYFSGVQLKDYGGIGGLKTIQVRSLGTHHTNVFYDGITIGNAQNGQVDLGKFSLSNMEEVSLFNGQNPSLLQPAKAYSSASAVYLKTKRPLFHDKHRWQGTAALKTGSFGLINPSFDMDYTFNDKISARVSTEWTHAHGRYKFRYTNGVYDTTAIRNNADIQALRSEVSLYGMPDSRTAWSAKFYHYHSKRGLPGAIVANRFDYSQRLWDDNNFIQIDFEREVTPVYQLAFKAKYASDYNRYLDPEFITTEGFLDNRYKQKEGYLSLANQVVLSPYWKTGLSIDYVYSTLDANLYRFAFPTRHTVLAALVSDFERGAWHIQGNVLGTFVHEKVKEFDAAQYENEYTPTVMFSWQPFSAQDIHLRSFYKSIFRMPTFNDLYYTFVGNSRLEPEYTDQYNIGFTYFKPMRGHLWRYISLQGDVYHNTVRNKIVAIPSANLFRWTMVNLGKVDIKGFELNTRAGGVLSPALTFSTLINYTYQKAIDITPQAFHYKHQIPYVPLHSGSLTAMVSNERYGANYSFIYTGERYSQKTNIPVNYVEPWYTHDISGWYTFPFKQLTCTARVEINNVLNQYYDIILNFPMPGRYYRFTLKLNI